jgi:cytidylate kinase
MPIITIDGPASSGKGTVAKIIAGHLGFHYLESGVIYRVLGLMVISNGIKSDNVSGLIQLIGQMRLGFVSGRVLLDGEDVTDKLRKENIGMMASVVGKIGKVREKLLDFQRGFATSPGLVTDGRDMGSVVFPDADLKIFLTASAEKRALRRYSQLQEYGSSATITSILRDIELRDQQDIKRSVAPLVYDSTFRVLDNSEMSVEETVQTILGWYKAI